MDFIDSMTRPGLGQYDIIASRALGLTGELIEFKKEYESYVSTHFYNTGAQMNVRYRAFEEASDFLHYAYGLIRPLDLNLIRVHLAATNQATRIMTQIDSLSKQIDWEPYIERAAIIGDTIKKIVFHGSEIDGPLNREHPRGQTKRDFIEEGIGYVIGIVIAVLERFGAVAEDIYQTNVEKLRNRHGKSFDQSFYADAAAANRPRNKPTEKPQFGLDGPTGEAGTPGPPGSGEMYNGLENMPVSKCCQDKGKTRTVDQMIDEVVSDIKRKGIALDAKGVELSPAGPVVGKIVTDGDNTIGVIE